MFLNNSADSVPTVYLSFLDDMLNVPEKGYNWGQAVLLFVLQPLSIMSRADRLHSLPTTSTSDVVMDAISDRKTEVNHSYSPQLKKNHILFIFYWRCMCKTEEPPLGGPETQLRPP
jgi:hypothetical protein